MFCDRLRGLAIGLLITHHHVVSRLTLEHLAHRIAAHRGLDGVLYVGHVDSKTRRLPAVDAEIEIWLTELAKKSEILHCRECAP